MSCNACDKFNAGGNIDFNASCWTCQARSMATSRACDQYLEGDTAPLLSAVERRFSGNTALGLRLVLEAREKISTKENANGH